MVGENDHSRDYNNGNIDLEDTFWDKYYNDFPGAAAESTSFKIAKSAVPH